MTSVLANIGGNNTPAIALLHADRLRRGAVDRLLFMGLLLWMLYSINGFRPPTQPITISDGNSGGGIRQILFVSVGLLAARRLLITGSLGSIVTMRLPLFLLGAYLVTSTAWSINPILTVKRSIVFLLGLLALTTAVHCVRRPVATMQRIVVYFCSAVAYSSIFFHITLPKHCTVNPLRPGLSGISNHPNTLAPFLAIAFLLSMGISTKGKEKTLLRFCQGGLLVALVMTNSITSINLVFCGLVVYFLVTAKAYVRGSTQLMIAVVIILIQLIGFQTVQDTLFEAAGRDSSLSGRDELWAVVGHEAMKRPIFGSGYGAFWYEGRGLELVHTWNPRQAHNAYIDAMADLGIIGLFLIVTLFHGGVMTRWQAIKGPPGSDQRKAAASMLACSVTLLTVYAMAQSFLFKLDSFPFFSFLWMLLLITNRDRNRLEVEFAQ